MSWKRLSRKTFIDTKFLKVYKDKVELPNGIVIPDYSVIEKPSFVMIVATNENNSLITIDEYKYAIDKTIHTLPAGHFNPQEEPLEAAKREFAEETGYSGGQWEYLGEFYDYPTKDLHKVHFIKATGVTKTAGQHLDTTENITIRLVSLDQLKTEIKNKEWPTNATLAALVAAGILS